MRGQTGGGDGRGSRVPVAIVGVGAILPDAPSAPAYWQNIRSRRYSITEVPGDRWRVEDYFDPDPSVPDKTYSKIGAWVRGFTFDWKGFRIPPKVAAAMDEGQQWAVSIAAEALADYGFPARPLDTERTGVIFGAAMGGELHYVTGLRVFFPEYANALASVGEFRSLPEGSRASLLEGLRTEVGRRFPGISEDSMPGELANVIAGRVANVFNLRGPNFIADAACASSFAALESACDLLAQGKADAILCGGVDRNMGPSTFVKFSKIGALSATGTRPFGDGADGFVMGEGAASFLLKRLDDAEQDGDKIYAVIRGVGASSDGKGKGITAPNPQGQILAIRRAWEDAGLDPATCTLVEAHGTSTKVGDVVEVSSLVDLFCGARPGSIGLGSAKSNVGHLKAGAGAAGLLKAVYAVHQHELPPTINAARPNPAIDFAATPFRLIQEPGPWDPPHRAPRRCGVSAYGFGGTNFHIVLEEYVPGALRMRTASTARTSRPAATTVTPPSQSATVPMASSVRPLRGVLALGAADPLSLASRLDDVAGQVAGGWLPPKEKPGPDVLAADERLVIDFDSGDELLDRVKAARKALANEQPATWRALANRGISRGHGPAAGKIAFLFPGQGSQYANMGASFFDLPPVAETFAEADGVLSPILGRPLTSFVFCDPDDKKQVAAAEEALRQTAITQPAVLTLDIALFRLLASFGFRPDVVMGHSLGEYAALVAAGVMPFAHALEAAAARGAEMTKVSVADNGWMAAVMAPMDVVQAVLAHIEGYVVPANINSLGQCVIGGASRAVEDAIAVFSARGLQAQRIPVSHAFHTAIVAPASSALRRVLDRLDVRSPDTPVISNVTGQLHPADPEGIKDLLERQIASPVQWVQGLETLYEQGCRAFVEVGPKRALKGFVDEALGARDGVTSILTCHPKTGETATLNQALCSLWAAGYGIRASREGDGSTSDAIGETVRRWRGGRRNETGRAEDSGMNGGNGSNGHGNGHQRGGNGSHQETAGETSAPAVATNGVDVISQALTLALDRMVQMNAQASAGMSTATTPAPWDRTATPAGSVVISGTGLGLPGTEKPLMDPDNALRLLRGEQLIGLVPERFRREMLAKRITRLVKAADGGGSFQVLTDPDDVIRLAGIKGSFDLVEEYGVPQKLVETLDITSQLAMAAGLEALREAGIPLVQTWRPTSTGKFLPDRWMIPAAMRDETGVIFASVFPGGAALAEEIERYYRWEKRLDAVAELEDLRRYVHDFDAQAEICRRIAQLRDEISAQPYEFDRRFLFRILSMGHSQFAEYIGARGPNTQVNAACATTTQAIALAEDWIRSGRCRRVLVIAGDDVTGDSLMEWVGAGFLALGAAATEDRVNEAALPFDRRRHGTIVGMGACALVVESEDAIRERGMRGIVEVLSTETANSAFHGSRLDVDHISEVMEALLSTAEKRFGVNRYAVAPYTVFVSHETYTPARGGSASAEVVALRKTFGEATRHVVVSNTKGFTGHPMGVGVEDVLAVKMLEHGMVPPVPNFEEVDPDLGVLNLSRGGHYPIAYALHLAAGFGSQVAMTFLRRVPGGPERVDDRLRYQHWLDAMSGYDRAELETVQHVLRVQSKDGPGRSPAPSLWRKGQGPNQRAAAPGDGIPGAVRPAPLWKVADQLGGGSAASEVSPRRAASRGESQRIEAPPPAPRPAPLQPVAVPVAPAPLAGRTAPEEPRQPVAAVGATTAAVAVAIATAPSVPAAAPEAEPVSAPVLGPASTDPVVDSVLEIVAAKTGYPQDMLDLELDLEADLGIDTVKQAETFASIRQAYDIPPQQGLSLRDYPTLKSVVGFVYKMRPDLAVERAGAVKPERPEPALALPAAPVSAAVASPGQEVAGTDPVTTKVLEIVASKTGYPQDMLDLELDLEADLGIDTVKQAETFASIRQAYDIPPQQGLSLREYPTLESVVGFVYKMRPDLATENLERVPQEVRPFDQPGTEAEAPPAPSAAAVRTIGTLEAADRIPRRVPRPALRPPLEACKPTGVVLGPGARVVIMLDEGCVGKELSHRLAEAHVEPLELEPGIETRALLQQLEAWRAQGPIHGIYWLPALDVEPALEELDLPAWRELNRRRVKNLYAAMRALYDSIAGPGTFLVSATRMGGLHGYGEDGASAPLGGGVTGFTKAYSVEQNLRDEGRGVLVKTVDVDREKPDEQIARRLISETLVDPAVLEVGYRNSLRYTINLCDEPARDGAPGLILGPDTVVLVTGAAGGITSAIVADLAAAGAGAFYLLDLAELPARDDEDVRLFREGRDVLKQALIEAGRRGGSKPKPAEIDRRIAAIERQAAALAAVEGVEAAGGKAVYRSVDLRDFASVQAVVEEIRSAHGRIDVLIHAAGLLVDKTLPDKQPEQFDLVFDVKVDGFFNLLKAGQGLPIGATVAFSSVAGRFGNNGQVDYSAANDLLCKLTNSFLHWRPDTRGIAIDWTAWGGIGMAARGSVPLVMEALGVDMLPPEAGVATVRRELTYGGTHGEVLIAGRLGAWLEERDATGGLDEAKSAALLAAGPRRPMVERLVSTPAHGGLEIETRLDPRVQPFLYDHAPDPDTPWLPGVMAIEALAEAATVLAPEHRVVAVEDVRMLGAMKFFRMEPRSLHISGAIRPAGGDLVAGMILRSVTQPAKPELPLQVREHFMATVRLRREVEEAARVPPESIVVAEDQLTVRAEEIYKSFFHGPAYRVIDAASVQGGRVVARMAGGLPSQAVPEDATTLMAPRLVELCFQAAALWSLKTSNAMAFPAGLASLRVYRQEPATDSERVWCALETGDGETFSGCVVDESGNVYVELKGYRTVARPA